MATGRAELPAQGLFQSRYQSCFKSLTPSSVVRLHTHRKQGFETLMMNCNPETVSTDYDTSTRLYFEPITGRSPQQRHELGHM